MIKVLSFDKFEVVYTWKGLDIIGSRYDEDTFVFRFPGLDVNRAIAEKIDFTYVFKDYEIPRFGDRLETFVFGAAKEDLEEKLIEELKDSLNQKLLLELVLDGIATIDK